MEKLLKSESHRSEQIYLVWKQAWDQLKVQILITKGVMEEVRTHTYAIEVTKNEIWTKIYKQVFNQA